ncbi:hypothetical protein MMC28_009568 [Mycoblastus sanguinarius]|nr:hypothetical protein [Mycoblastus sanguinarius]
MPPHIGAVKARGVNTISDLNARQVELVVITSFLIFLSTLTVALRLVSRWMFQKPFFLDDYVIVFALLLSYGDCICQFVGVQYGLGQHMDEIGRQTKVSYFIIWYILQLFWNTTLPAIKISILLFYRRLYPVRSLHITSSIIGAIVVAWYIAIQVTAIVQCLPIRYYWQRTGQGYCIHLIRFNIALASINLVTDVAVLILPIPAIWRLQLPKSKKIGLSAVFLAGLLVCIASVIRLKTLTGIDAKDITWSNAYPGLWAAIEASLGVVAACLPSLGRIRHKMIGRSPSTPKTTSAPVRTRKLPSASSDPSHYLLSREASLAGFERILERYPGEREDAVVLNRIRASRGSHEMEVLREDGRRAERGGGILVRKDFEQWVE